MYGIMLGTGMRLIIGLAVQRDRLLHTQHGLYTQHRIQVRILTTCLLTTTPTRIAEDIDVRTPERQFRIAWIVGHAHRYIEQLWVVVVSTVPVGTSLIRNLREYVVHQFFAKCSGQANRLGVDGITSLTNTMTGLTPPVVRRNAETVYRYRLVHHQTHLLFRGQHSQQALYTFSTRQLGVLPGILCLSIHTDACKHRKRN